MKKATAELTFVTPCISSGADQKRAEIRSQSLRGLLHFWFRALGGTLDEEQRIFGRIGKQNEVRRSSLNVRVRVPDDLRVSEKDARGLTGSDFDYFLWPMRSQKHSPGVTARGVVDPGQSFELRLMHTRISGGSDLPERAVKAALLLGSLGTRSRRCYGSLWPTKIMMDGEINPVPDSPDSISAELQDLLQDANIRVLRWGNPKNDWKQAVGCAASTLKAFRCGSEKSGTPSRWGRDDHNVPLERGQTVYRPALGLPLAQRYGNGRGDFQTCMLSQGRGKGNDRWASPLLLKVVPWGAEYQALAIFMNDYVMREGQTLSIRSKSGSASPSLSLDLWQAMQNPDEQTYKGQAKELS